MSYFNPHGRSKICRKESTRSRPTCLCQAMLTLVLSFPLLTATSIIHLWPFQESFSIDFLYCFNKRLPIDRGTTMNQQNPPALIYQSTGEMNAWHMARSISRADFNGLGFLFFCLFFLTSQSYNDGQLRAQTLQPLLQPHLFYITDFIELFFTASGRCASNSEHSVRTRSRVPNNDEHKWTPRPEERKQRQREKEREINGLQGNVSEAERGKKDVYICSSMQSAHVCVWEPSVMYSRQRWWMRPFL